MPTDDQQQPPRGPATPQRDAVGEATPRTALEDRDEAAHRRRVGAAADRMTELWSNLLQRLGRM